MINLSLPVVFRLDALFNPLARRRVMSCPLRAYPSSPGAAGCLVNCQVSVHEKSQYARQMFEVMQREIEEQARRFRKQGDGGTLASLLAFS